MSNAHYGLAEVAHLQGDYDTALQNLQSSLELTETDNQVQVARVLGRIGSIHWAIGNYPQARHYLEKGLAVAREAGFKGQIALWLGNLGALAHVLKEYREARQYYEESIDLAREIGDRSTEITSLKNLGELYYDTGNYDEARRYLQENIDRCQEIGDFVFLRSDQTAPYNFACVIDDASMKITHVIRGEGHISNTYRQLLIYQALGFDPPRFAHLSTILGADGAKLSKRHGATSIDEFRGQGYAV